MAVSDVFLVKSIFTGIAKLGVEATVEASVNATAEEASEGVFTITQNGVVLPKGAEISNEFIENPYRNSSYGIMEDGKFVEKLRIDQATPPNMKGPEISHFHLDGSKEHIFDIARWPWWH